MFKKVIGSALIAGSLAGGLALAAPANADTPQEIELENTICSYLDRNPTPNGVVTVVGIQVGNGMSSSHTARITFNAVNNICPRHYELVKNTAERYSS